MKRGGQAHPRPRRETGGGAGSPARNRAAGERHRTRRRRPRSDRAKRWRADSDRDGHSRAARGQPPGAGKRCRARRTQLARTRAAGALGAAQARRSRPCQIPLQITVLNVPALRCPRGPRSPEMVGEAREIPFARIVSCRVNIEELRRHRSRGRLYHVRVDLRVPGKEPVSSHRHDKDPYLALRDAFLSLRRQLEDVSRVKRGEVKKHPARKTPRGARERHHEVRKRRTPLAAPRAAAGRPEHDSYKAKGKLPDPTRCPECGAVYQRGAGPGTARRAARTNNRARPASASATTIRRDT